MKTENPRGEKKWLPPPRTMFEAVTTAALSDASAICALSYERNRSGGNSLRAYILMRGSQKGRPLKTVLPGILCNESLRLGTYRGIAFVSSGRAAHGSAQLREVGATVDGSPAHRGRVYPVAD